MGLETGLLKHHEKDLFIFLFSGIKLKNNKILNYNSDIVENSSTEFRF